MTEKKVILLLIIFTFTLLGQTVPNSYENSSIQTQFAKRPRIYHIPPKKLPYNKFSVIECVVESDSLKLKTIKIFIRNSRERIFKEFPMQYKDGKYIFKLIPEMVRAKYLYYFITAEFTNFSIVAFPPDNPQKNPVKVNMVKTKRVQKNKTPKYKNKN